MRRSFFPASLSLLLCSALLSGCVVTNDYIAFDSKAAPSPQIKRYDGNEWASERAVMVAAEKTNNWQTVISVGNDVIAKNPTNVEARIYLARAFTKTGDPRQALRVLSFISGVDTAELRIERARALIALTDFEEAVKLLKPLTDGSDLQKLSAEDRRSAKSLAAVAYSMSKNYAAADKLYEELLAELDNPIIRYNYARSLYLEGRAEDSLAQLQPIIDQVPAAKPAAVAALMKLGRENDVRRLLKGELDDEKIEELISAIKEKTKRRTLSRFAVRSVRSSAVGSVLPAWNSHCFFPWQLSCLLWRLNQRVCPLLTRLLNGQLKRVSMKPNSIAEQRQKRLLRRHLKNGVSAFLILLTSNSPLRARLL